MLHLIGRGNNGIRVFRNRNDFLKFSRTLLRYTAEDEIFIHHYALMHTHFHLLAWVEDTRDLATTIKSITLSYHHYYRRRYKYRGHLWHSRYRSVIINDESQWLHCGRYIEINPVLAGICMDPGGYEWSSYRYYAFGKTDQLINPVMHPGGVSMHKPRTNNRHYQEFIRAGIDMDYQTLKKQYELRNVREDEH